VPYDWRAEYRGESVFIPKGWEPTIENINALPMPLRHFIHMLQTECDRAGTIRENVLIKEENHALRLKLRELDRERG
jgi:hypothetical protein